MFTTQTLDDSKALYVQTLDDSIDIGKVLGIRRVDGNLKEITK